MRGIILAAGRGSRMGHLTDEYPKCRTVLAGKSLIQWQLDSLRGADIIEIALVRGYLADTFEFDLHYFDNRRWAESNMVRSLLEADQWLSQHPCIVSYSDIVYSTRSVQHLLACNSDLAITYDPNWIELWSARFEDPLSDAETFKLKDNRLVEIGLRTDTLEDIEGQYMGLLKFSPPGWFLIKKLLSRFSGEQIDKMDMTSLLQYAILAKIHVEAVAIEDAWYEVDTESDLELYEKRGVQINNL